MKDCTKVRKIWFGFRLGIHFEDLNTGFKGWLIHMINTADKENLIYLASISYNIWFARNLQRFEDKDTSTEGTISIAAHLIVEFNQATSVTRQTDTRSTTNIMRSTCMHNNKSWEKPNSGRFKANSNVNLSYVGTWGVGPVICNEDGEVLAAATWTVKGFDDVIVAEVYAMYKTVKFAAECCFRKIILESDCEKLVKILREEVETPRNCVGSFVNGIRQNLHYFEGFSHTNTMN